MRLDVSSQISARQRIQLKNQALFSLKDKSKKVKCRLLQFLYGAVRVKGKYLHFRSKVFTLRVDPLQEGIQKMKFELVASPQSDSFILNIQNIVFHYTQLWC